MLHNDDSGSSQGTDSPQIQLEPIIDQDLPLGSPLRLPEEFPRPQIGGFRARILGWLTSFGVAIDSYAELHLLSMVFVLICRDLGLFRSIRRLILDFTGFKFHMRFTTERER